MTRTKLYERVEVRHLRVRDIKRQRDVTRELDTCYASQASLVRDDGGKEVQLRLSGDLCAGTYEIEAMPEIGDEQLLTVIVCIDGSVIVRASNIELHITNHKTHMPITDVGVQ